MTSSTEQQATAEEIEAEIQYWIRHETKLVERTARLTLRPLVYLGYRLKAYGAEQVPEEGPFIMVANHSSYMDPFLLMASHRLARFMGKSQLFDHNPLRAIVAGGGGFPVRRGMGDTFAMDVARRMIDDGQPIALFPEGTRFRSSDDLGPSKRGAARLAVETGVPVMPVAIYGAKPRSARGKPTLPPRPPRVTNVYGAPMSFGTDDAVDDVRDEIWDEVNRLYDIGRDLDRKFVRPRRFDVPPRSAAALAAADQLSSIPGR